MYHILTLKFISLRFKLSPIIHCMKRFIVLEFVKEIFCDLEISRISPETMPLQNWIILPCVTWTKVDWWKDRHCIGKCMTAPSKLKISRKEDTFTSYTCHECCVSENSALPLEGSRRIYKQLCRMHEILNHCMILHVEKEMTEKLNMSDIGNQFVSYQMTGKIALENSMSIKTFSSHVSNSKTKWQLIISTKAFTHVSLISFFC